MTHERPYHVRHLALVPRIPRGIHGNRGKFRGAARRKVRRVFELMTRGPATVPSHALAIHAELLATSQNVHHLPVVEAGRLVGVLCLCDLWGVASETAAAEVMTSPAATIDSRAPIAEAVSAMCDLAIGCLPVLDGEVLVGILTRGDLYRAGLLDENLIRTCASCGARHHVRVDPAAYQDAVAFCFDCLDRGRAFDRQDPYEELGGDG